MLNLINITNYMTGHLAIFAEEVKKVARQRRREGKLDLREGVGDIGAFVADTCVTVPPIPDYMLMHHAL
jgi:hypothetical protein